MNEKPKTYRYTGTFDAYYEMGMGGHAMTFHSDKGVSKVPGADHDAWSFDHLLWFSEFLEKGGEVLYAKIRDKSGEVVHDGPLTLSKSKNHLDVYELGERCYHARRRMVDVVFNELGYEKTYYIFHGNYKGELEVTMPVRADEESR